MEKINMEEWLRELDKYSPKNDCTLTEKEKEFLKLARDKGLSFANISAAFYNVFGKKYSPNYFNNIYRKLFSESTPNKKK